MSGCPWCEIALSQACYKHWCKLMGRQDWEQITEEHNKEVTLKANQKALDSKSTA